METDKISFWKFIQENTIEIPIIQRDYAQGRIGKEYLRASFLKELKEALDNKEKPLKLDFVYDSQENNHLQPLDGQQRLTTLWLLHWYIALRAGKLREASEILKKFSYETRISSREFCENLCRVDNFEKFVEGSVVDFITQQTWFYSFWKQDPTIQAMLRMLAGEDEVLIDNIEKLFEKGTKEDFDCYWRLLTEETPIAFYYQPLENFGLSDDLYIKMNARGKQLTPFENFKADLIGYIEQQAKEKEEWKRLLDIYRGIPILLDTEWLDIFWKNKSATHQVDEIYYAFLNRFFWNYYVGYSKETGSKIELTSVYKYLNKDNYATYESLENYTNNEGIPLELFEDLQKVLNNFGKYSQDKLLKEVIPNAQWEEIFSFIPEYKEGGITGITEVQRIVFSAICKYFKEGKGETVSLKRWMRVVWNLLSGKYEGGARHIVGIEIVKKAIDYINILDSHNVYNSLCSQELKEDKPFERRWNEEIEKAKKICEDTTWEEKIKTAENYAFFRGSIRFLFRDGQGNIDWSLFDPKWENVQKYFKEEGVGEEKSAMKEDYNNADLLKSLISRMDTSQFGTVLWWRHKTFNNIPNTWLYYLLNQDIMEPVHLLLLGDTQVVSRQPSKEGSWEHILYQLSNTSLLDFVINNKPNYWIRSIHGYLAIYPSEAGIFLDNSKRDEILLRDDKIIIDQAYIVGNKEYLYGWDIDFKFNSHSYRWYSDNYIYLLDEEGRCIAKQPSKGSQYEDRYYCFLYDNTKNIKEELRRIHQEYEENKEK